MFLGDLLTQLGNGPAVTSGDILEDAIAAEEPVHPQDPAGRPWPPARLTGTVAAEWEPLRAQFTAIRLAAGG